MVIGLPARSTYAEFLKCGDKPTGYCIDVFKNAIGKLSNNISYMFVCYNGTYSELIEQVYYKNFDAAVGDITIMANRSKYVDFTQPYMESSLSMIAPVKEEHHTWLFVKPFTAMTWLMIFMIFVHTMLVVWLLERRSNPDFTGPRVNQLSTALWFTFSTLFFAHRENIRSNYTRVVMFSWFCAVMVIGSSYPSSLTTILTLQHLKPTVTDVYQLQRINATVGCDGSSFYRNYLEDILKFNPDKIININLKDYPNALNDGTISAAFLELPYARLLLSQNSNYKDSSGQKDRFGGLGFAFPLGSQLAKDFSSAFLTLSEDGTLKKLEEKWFPPNPEDSRSESNIEDQRLGPSNFTGIFLVTWITSIVTLILYYIFGHQRDPPVDLANNAEPHEANDEPHSSGSNNISCFYTPRREIQLQEIHIGIPDNHTRPLRQTMSFPAPHRLACGRNYLVPPRQPISHRTSV